MRAPSIPDLLIAAYTVWARYPVRKAWPPSLFAMLAFETTMLVGDNSNPIGDTVIAVLVVLGFATIYWFASARHWFKGPKVQGSAEELAAIENELESLA